MHIAPRHRRDICNVCPIVAGGAAEQDGPTARRLSGSDVSLRVADQEGLRQVNSVTVGGLVQQTRFGFAALAPVAVIVGTDEDVIDICSLCAKQLAQSLVNLVERGL